MLSIIAVKDQCGWSFFSYGKQNKVIKTKKKSVCQGRIIIKYACAEEDGRKYNTDGTDLTNTGPHSMLFSLQKNKALTYTSSKLLLQTGKNASEFLSYSNQISDLVCTCSLGAGLSCLAGRSSTLP